MNTALWIAQGLLAFAFIMAGAMKLLQPKDKLLDKMAFVEDFSQSTVRLIGLLEVLGAIGVIVPALTGIMPELTPWAATGLALIMLVAALVHVRRGEYPMIGVNTVLFALAAFVAYGRWVVMPF